MEEVSQVQGVPGPLVSVIIPAYNRPKFLQEAMQSVLRQTYQNIELIVSDNSCAVDSRAVVESFADPRVRYLRVTSTYGMADNNLVGFRAARGKYFANLHDDDVWHDTLLEKLVPALEAHSEVVVSFSDHNVMDQSGNLKPVETEANTRHFGRDKLSAGVHQPFSYLALVPVAVPMSMSAVIRRSAIDLETDFPKLPSCYDFWLAYLACRDGGGAYYLPERLMNYRWHPGNDTATGRIRITESLVTCFSEILKDARLRDLFPVLRRLLGDAHANLAMGLLRAGRPREARPHLRKGVRLAPSFVRVILAVIVTITPTRLLQVDFLREAWPKFKLMIRRWRS